MAHLNYVFLYGQVNSEIKLKQKEGMLDKCTFQLKVINRLKENKSNLIHSTPEIVSLNPEIIETMKTLRVGDICMLKGVITSHNISKKLICGECGYQNVFPAVATIVTPIYLKKVVELNTQNLSIQKMSDEDKQLFYHKGNEYLIEQNEISNTIHIIGTVCSNDADLHFYQDDEDSEHNAFSFTLAIDRHYRIKEGSPDERTDYIHVKTTGQMAIEASQVLHQNSTICIDGRIMTKRPRVQYRCAKCGSIIEKENNVIEIVPYSIEYLHDCNLPDTK